MHQAVVTSVITHLASLDCYTPEQLLGRLPQECSIETLSEGGFLCAHWATTGSKESGTVHRNTERPRNAVGEGILLLNTDGVLLRGAGLCGRRYSR